MKIAVPKKILEVENNISEFWKVEKTITLFDKFKLSYVKDVVEGNDNKIFVRKHVPSGESELVLQNKINGASLKICGSNNMIIYDESVQFSNSTIYIWGNNNKIEFEEGVKVLKTVIDMGTNSEYRYVYIGKNNCLLEDKIHCWGDSINFEMGDNCLLSNGITILTSDGHKIFNNTTGEIANKPKSVKIGSGCWIGKQVTICKNVTIPNNCIIGINSVVTKSFDQENVAIAGNPAKIVKTNVRFEP